MDLSRLQIDRQAKARSPRRGRWLVPALVALVAGTAVWLLAGERILTFARQRLQGGGAAVQTTRALRVEAIRDSVQTTAAGYVVARTTASLGTKVLGRLAKLFAEPGDRVTEGQVLAELEHADLDAMLAAAQADHERAKAEVEEARQRVQRAELDLKVSEATVQASEQRTAESQARRDWAKIEIGRVEGLHRSQQASDRDLDLARIEERAWNARGASLEAQLVEDRLRRDVAASEVGLARSAAAVAERAALAWEARARQAEATRNDAFIRAPFAGVVLRKEAEVGEVVAPSPGGSTLSRSAVLTMADFRTLELEVDVFERDIRKVVEGGPVRIVLEAYPDEPRRGRVRLIQPTADRQKATVLVKTVWESIPDFARPEMRGSVLFLSPEAAAQAEERTRVLVPEAALDLRDGKPRVWVVRGGRALPVEVVPGSRAQGRVEIARGLSGGEEIIVGPPADLRDGLAVRATKVTEPSK